MQHILLIGLGPHAKRIYFPIFHALERQGRARIVCAVDLQSKQEDIETYLASYASRPELLYVLPEEQSFDQIPPTLHKKLKQIVQKHQITGVVIATEPLTHVMYAAWALSQGLSILMDKPVSAVEQVATSERAAAKLVADYMYLRDLYALAKRKYPQLVFNLMAQRRYHAAYQKIKELVSEVSEKTNCPVTSIQSFHSDGQWRLPTEIVEQHYHSYNQGYGKLCHSGYHFIDLFPWLLKSTIDPAKKVDSADIFTQFLTPLDFLSQLTLTDYRKIFPDFDTYNKYTETDYASLMKDFGEIDAFSSFAFKHKDKTMTLASLNLVHNGFSQRGWPSTQGRDLYKGNGRVRHESHYILQGPFQAISFLSYQSQEVNPETEAGIYEVGGEYHLDIHVFRNSTLFPNWKAYEKVSVTDLQLSVMAGKSRGHQEDARRQAVLEFVDQLDGIRKKEHALSDFDDHAQCITLLSGMYLSGIRRRKGENPLVTISL